MLLSDLNGKSHEIICRMWSASRTQTSPGVTQRGGDCAAPPGGVGDPHPRQLTPDTRGLTGRLRVTHGKAAPPVTRVWEKGVLVPQVSRKEGAERSCSLLKKGNLPLTIWTEKEVTVCMTIIL